MINCSTEIFYSISWFNTNVIHFLIIANADVPAKYSCKLLFFLTFIITAVLIPSYSASLVSYLTVSPTLVPFENMKEFFETETYKMTVRKGTYEYDIFSVRISSFLFRWGTTEKFGFQSNRD